MAASFLRLKRFDVIHGRCLGVMGLGPACLAAAQMARAEGASEVIGFDLSPQRRAFALQRLDAAFDPRDAADFPARPAPSCLDTTIDCIGENFDGVDYGSHAGICRSFIPILKINLLLSRGAVWFYPEQ